jgi:N-glycosylase/DNA lyase
LGLGYRAKYLEGTVRIIREKGGAAWLEGLKGEGHEKVKEGLLCLPGIGPKAADCIALMCLDQTGAIPVDTHVWKIACRDYLPELAEVLLEHHTER